MAEVMHRAITVLPLGVPRRPVDNLAEGLCQGDTCKAVKPATAKAQDCYPVLV